MPGKPYQSKLRSCHDEIFSLLDGGMSYRQVAEVLNRKYGLGVTHNAVFSYVKPRRPARRGKGLFHEGLAPDIRDALIRQITAVWTHDSTAIEGNTLTLGETVKVLELGLTISGKSLREHQEVYGHARAIDLIYRMIEQPALTGQDLFDLHRAVMDKTDMDIMKPVGGWKQDFNGTTGVIAGKSVHMEYAAPSDVPRLMERWLAFFNDSPDDVAKPASAARVYARAHMSFVRIHPFFDGNGRVARLIANLPLLRGGYPPVVIPRERRADYIDVLWEYQNAVGPIKRGSRLLPPHPALRRFETLVIQEWAPTVKLVEEARHRDASRRAEISADPEDGRSRRRRGWAETI
jgi:fido (protein-threonine AMPylation protein)